MREYIRRGGVCSKEEELLSVQNLVKRKNRDFEMLFVNNSNKVTMLCVCFAFLCDCYLFPNVGD
jgi:hypothetical protein